MTSGSIDVRAFTVVPSASTCASVFRKIRFTSKLANQWPGKLRSKPARGAGPLPLPAMKSVTGGLAALSRYQTVTFRPAPAQGLYA
jgi:hypothetical protein